MHADPAIRRADVPATRDDLTLRWQAAPDLQDSPDRYELNEFGELILSPRPTTGHQAILFEVGLQIAGRLGPRAATETAVLTDRGIRVPDLIWMPADRWEGRKDQSPLESVPDVCVEVLSPGNTRQEIEMKIGAYLRGGAREVIVVGLKGEIEIFDSQGKRATSALGIALALPPELF